MHGSYTQLMYGKYMLFYESPKNWGYLRAWANSVYQASPQGVGERPGNEATVKDWTAVQDAFVDPIKTCLGSFQSDEAFVDPIKTCLGSFQSSEVFADQRDPTIASSLMSGCSRGYELEENWQGPLD